MKIIDFLKEHYVKATFVCSIVLSVLAIVAIVFSFCGNDEKMIPSEEKEIHVFINQDDSIIVDLKKEVELLNEKVDKMCGDTLRLIIERD